VAMTEIYQHQCSRSTYTISPALFPSCLQSQLTALSEDSHIQNQSVDQSINFI